MTANSPPNSTILSTDRSTFYMLLYNIKKFLCETIPKLGNDDTKHIYQNIKNLYQNNTYSYSKAGKSSRHLKTRFLLEVTIKRCFQCHMGNRRDRGKHFHPYLQLALLTEKPVLTQESVNTCTVTKPLCPASRKFVLFIK